MMSEIILFCLGTVGLDIISFCLGAVLVLIAVVGGGLKIKELSIPKVNRFARIISGIMGFVFVIVGLWVGGMFQLSGGTGGTGPETDSNNVTDTSGGPGGTRPQTDPISKQLDAPEQLYPPDNSTIKSTQPLKLSWKAVRGAVSYKVKIYEWKSADKYIAGHWERKKTIPNIESTTYTLKNVRAPTRLNWSVWAVDAAGKEGPPSKSQQFSYIK